MSEVSTKIVPDFPGKRKIEVLLADHSDKQRRKLRFILRSSDFDITEVVNGFRFMSEINRHFDIVLFDSQLPGIEEMRCLKELRRKSPRTPVIVFISQVECASLEEFYQLGAVDIMCKPVSDRFLIHSIERAFRISASGDRVKSSSARA